MPVVRLELDNFKSYAGRQTIGPFVDTFTSIIGPNGAGKSNLMDAMSFVLGVQSKDLRSSQLKDLIFRAPGNDANNSLSARAALVYRTPDTGVETVFGRTISARGVGEYQVDGHTVSFADYCDALAEIGVLVKARNFLVFQGDVESLARKSPTELVALLEQISGSGQYQEPYQQALQAKEQAEAQQMFLFRKQKTFKSERKLYKDQKLEADRFHDLLESKAGLQTDLYLWLLFHLEQDRTERLQVIQELKQSHQDHQDVIQNATRQLKANKKASSAARRATAQAEQAKGQVAAQLDNVLEPGIIQASEETKSLEKKLAQDGKALDKKKLQLDQHAETVAAIVQEISDYQATRAELELDYQTQKDKQAAESGGNTVSLTPDQEVRYETLRQQAAAASAAPRRTLTDAQRSLTRKRTLADQESQLLQASQQTLVEAEASVVQLTNRRDTITNSVETTSTELAATEKELVRFQKEAHTTNVRRQELDLQLEQLDTQIRRQQASIRRSKDEERLLTALASLQRHFPGVHGRLVDVCRPTARKYALAVTVAAGKDMDAIVVDTRATALECIRYLREQRIGTATFLPLDTVQVPTRESTERLRAMCQNNTNNNNNSSTTNGSKYSLVMDVIATQDDDNNNSNNGMRKAVMYAVGNTIVADDLDSARELCFGSNSSSSTRSSGRGGGESQNARVKAVTLGGAVISKAGTMTGGVTRQDNNRAGRWDAQELDKLVQSKNKLEEERSRLLDSSSSSGRDGGGGGAGRMEELKNKLGNFKNKQQYSKSDLEFTKGQLDEKQVLVKSTKKQVAKLEKKVAAAEKEFKKAEAKVQEAIQAVKEAEDEHLADFREETGLQDLNAYEEAIGKTRDDFNSKKRTVMEHIAQLEQQKTYEEGRNLKEPIVRIEKRIKERQAALAKCKKKEVELNKKVDKAKEELAEAEQKVAEAGQNEESFESDVQTAQTEFDEAQTEHVRISKAISSEETALERLRSKLHETLQKSRVEEVILPMVGATQSGRTRSQRRSGVGADSDEEMEITESSQRSASESGEASSYPFTQDSQTRTHFSQAQDTVVVRDQQMSDNIDFGRLPENLKSRVNDRDAKRKRKEFEEKIAKVAADIESITPNMKASEAFKAVTERLKDSNSDYEKAKDEASKAAKAFQRIKSRRTKTFTEAFNHIDEALKTIYTDMTKSSKHPLGGNAYLSLEDAEEPYKGGLKFNAMPPMKRFRDMEQLSGGEKTVAALSLLFAIHSFHPAPFFVMDEVDAALDNVNLNKVCNYIKQRSQTDFQCIVISLKDMFYEHSQGLVGIYRDAGTNSSSTLTLDLTKYDKKNNKNRRVSSSTVNSKRLTLGESSTMGSPSPRSRRSRTDMSTPGDVSTLGSPSVRSPRSTPGTAASRGRSRATPGSESLASSQKSPESAKSRGRSRSTPGGESQMTAGTASSRGRSLGSPDDENLANSQDASHDDDDESQKPQPKKRSLSRSSHRQSKRTRA